MDYSKLAELGVLGGLGAAGARGARRDANTQINDIKSSQNLFGQDSPYAQQLRQQLERKDAQAGRRSQYGPREVELQARLAEASSRQQAQNAPTLNKLYEQKQAAGTSRGRDFAAILARSGGFSKLSPLVKGLFRRRMEDGPEANGGDPSNTFDYNASTAESYGADPSNTFDYGGGDYGADPSNTFDYGGGLDYGAMDYGADPSNTFDYSGGFDFGSGADAAYEVDYGSLPGFAEGGKIDIFQALKGQKPGPYKEPDQGIPGTSSAGVAPRQRVNLFNRPEVETSMNDRQIAGRGVQAANLGSKLLTGNSLLGAYGGVPGILTAKDAQGRGNAAMTAALYAVNPILGLMSSVVFGLGGTKSPRMSDEMSAKQQQMNQETGKDWSWVGDEGRLDPVDEITDDVLQKNEYGTWVDDDWMATQNEKHAAIRNADMQNTPGGFATGGPVIGPGTGTSDSIVARLSHGEYVNTAKTVDSLGTSLFDKLEAKAKKSSPEELKKFKAGLQALF